jgi:hypothetical protein
MAELADGAALEMLYRRKSVVGSNPTLSAIDGLKREGCVAYIRALWPGGLRYWFSWAAVLL